jgi:hypothetical protein
MLGGSGTAGGGGPSWSCRPRSSVPQRRYNVPQRQYARTQCSLAASFIVLIEHVDGI